MDIQGIAKKVKQIDRDNKGDVDYVVFVDDEKHSEWYSAQCAVDMAFHLMIEQGIARNRVRVAERVISF